MSYYTETETITITETYPEYEYDYIEYVERTPLYLRISGKPKYRTVREYTDIFGDVVLTEYHYNGY